MTDGATSPNSVSYVVYMPYGPRAGCYPIPVSKGGKIRDLIKNIREDTEFQRHVESEDVYLYKCGELPMQLETDDPEVDRYEQAIKWLHGHGKKRKMNGAFLLGEYFPSGPAAYKKRKIDVIVATDSILDKSLNFRRLNYLIILDNGNSTPDSLNLEERLVYLGDLRDEIYERHQPLFKPVDRSSLVLFTPEGLKKDSEDLLERVREIEIDLNQKKLDGGIEIKKSKLGTTGFDTTLVHLVVKVNKFATSSNCPASPLAGHICRREATVKALWEKIKKYGLILVRGTPGSGKSILAKLLFDYVREANPSANVILVDVWKKREETLAGKGWKEYLKERTWREGDETVFIIDEAQTSYHDTSFWLGFCKNIEDAKGVRMVAFASYGSVTSHLEIEGSPMEIPAEKKISLRPVDHKDDLSPVGLLFNREEFDDVVRLKYEGVERHRFDQTFFNGLFKITGGHPGAIADVLLCAQADRSYREIKRSEGASFTWDTFQTSFDTREFTQSIAKSSSIFKRGLPRDDDLREAKIYNTLSAVVRRHVVKASEADGDLKDGLDFCSRKGWLHNDFADNNGSVGYFFASPLHQWYIEWKLFLDNPPQVDLGDDLLKFVLDIIQRFNPRALSENLNLGPGNHHRPPEAQYQDEFYRCCHVKTSGILVTFPEYGEGSGRVDFYIPSKKWGIELLREGDRLAEHVKRFEPKGRYRGLTLGDFVILDFRTTMPRVPHSDFLKLYHIVFDNDYQRVRVLDREVKVVEEGDFVLVRDS